MALERQKTIKVNLTKPIDSEIEEFLKNNEIDPAAIQIVIDSNGSTKRAHLIYANREDLKKKYEEQGRVYSDLDAVTYCHVKDISVNRGGSIDDEINSFLTNDNISAISISNYITQVSEGAVILYIDLPEQQEKMKAKQEEIMKQQEELANKLASEAVKDVDLETNDTIEKYASVTDDNSPIIEETDKVSNAGDEDNNMSPIQESEKSKKKFGKKK